MRACGIAADLCLTIGTLTLASDTHCARISEASIDDATLCSPLQKLPDYSLDKVGKEICAYFHNTLSEDAFA
jgi:hypothetical protein